MMPESISTFGPPTDALFWAIVWICGIWFIVAELVLFSFMFMFRSRPGVRAQAVDGTTIKSLRWIFVPVAVILVLDFYIDLRSAPLWSQMKQELPESDLTVRVIAKQFAWGFLYPGPDGKFDTDDDFDSGGGFHVPVGKPVRFELTGTDVLHSFFVPNLRLKQDVVPGRKVPGWFHATKTGEYPIICAEICGSLHWIMRSKLIVHEAAAFDEWLAEKQAEGA